LRTAHLFSYVATAKPPASDNKRNPQHDVSYLATQGTQVSVPKNEENAPTGESAQQRSKRRKDKLIRLADLIPKQDVKGGRRLLFGATETTQTTNPTSEK
jgi:hypothetical protein